MLLRKNIYVLFSLGKRKNHLWQKAIPSRKVLVQLDVYSDARWRAGAVFFLILFLLKTWITVDLHIVKKHSHKKRKSSLGGSLDRVLFEAQLEFRKMLAPRLPQNSSNVNIESVGKLKQLYSLCDKLLGALIYLHFIIVILIYF